MSVNKNDIFKNQNPIISLPTIESNTSKSQESPKDFQSGTAQPLNTADTPITKFNKDYNQLQAQNNNNSPGSKSSNNLTSSSSQKNFQQMVSREQSQPPSTIHSLVSTPSNRNIPLNTGSHSHLPPPNLSSFSPHYYNVGAASSTPKSTSTPNSFPSYFSNSGTSLLTAPIQSSITPNEPNAYSYYQSPKSRNLNSQNRAGNQVQQQLPAISHPPPPLPLASHPYPHQPSPAVRSQNQHFQGHSNPHPGYEDYSRQNTLLPNPYPHSYAPYPYQQLHPQAYLHPENPMLVPERGSKKGKRSPTNYVWTIAENRELMSWTRAHLPQVWGKASVSHAHKIKKALYNDNPLITPENIRHKINNLKAKYRKIKGRWADDAANHEGM